MPTRLEKIQTWVRPQVRGLNPYEPEAAGPRIRLDANESPWDVPAALKAEICRCFETLTCHRYPDPEYRSLRAAIAEMEGVPVEQVVAGNGSDEIIRDLLVSFGGPGTRTIFPAPTFSMYRHLTMALGGTPVGVELLPDWGLDVARVVQELEVGEAGMAFIASPNNPTGKAYPLEQLEELLKQTDRLVVVDEAYRWFSNQTMVPRLAQYPNLLVLCTLSKTCSCAGIRIGYALAHPAVIDIINRVRLPYNVDVLAQAAAEVVLHNPDFWKENVKVIVAQRELLAARLQQLKTLTVYPSQANFILVRLPQANAVRLELAKKDIAVRGFPQTPLLTDCLRITVGTAEENQALLAALDQILKSR